MEQRVFSPVSRLKALRLGGSIIAGTTLAACSGGSNALTGSSDGTSLNGAGTAAGAASQSAGTRETVQSLSKSAIMEIQQIINAQGTYDSGVLSIEIDRNDIEDVHWRGYKVLPSFEINGTLVFQCLGGSTVYRNADMALKLR